MKNGFVKVAAATPDIRVADVEFNTQNIINAMEEAQKNGAKILVFPELCVTGYTCSDLFDHSVLLKASRKALLEIAENTNDKDMLVFVGAPLEVNGKLYNVAAAMNQGEIIGFTTKTFLPNYGEFYEMRQFTPGPQTVREITFEGKKIPFGPQILFQAEGMEELVVAAEICEDVWSPVPPSIQAALEGATVIVNCSASDETIGKDTYRRALISGQSARLISGYIYANAGEGESTTDLVFGGHNIIAENGTILKESSRYVNEIIYSELDLQRITGERRKNTTFQPLDEETLVRVPFTVEETKTFLTRTFPKKPFVPSDEQTRAQRCEEILTIQAMGLKKRLAHTNARTAVVGISGGLALYYSGRENPPHPEIWINYFLRMMELYSKKVYELSKTSENDELDGSLSYLNAKEKEFLAFLLKKRLYEFTPIEVSKMIGVTNKTVINRCAKLVNNGLLIPIIVKTRVRSYRLSDFSKTNEKKILKKIS